MKSYAISLFSIIDRGKVDLNRPIPESLAEQLVPYFTEQLGIPLLSMKLVQGGEDSLLVLQGIESDGLPALFALADVQKTQVFEYERDGEESIRLTPILVNPDSMENG